MGNVVLQKMTKNCIVLDEGIPETFQKHCSRINSLEKFAYASTHQGIATCNAHAKVKMLKYRRVNIYPLRYETQRQKYAEKPNQRENPMPSSDETILTV